jgi:aryl-alcohol dehydrogenase-like predicted oxidoreductase
MDALDILVKQGKVLYLGASDMPAWIVSACNEYAKWVCLAAPVTSSEGELIVQSA